MGDDARTVAGRLHDARTSGGALPLATGLMEGLDLEGAYAVQAAYLELLLDGDTVAGYKAALTAPPAQAAFGFSTPVIGVLLESGRRDNGAVVDADSFGGLMIETEVGFVLGERVDEPVTDPAALRRTIAHCLPMIELADVAFGGASAGGLDLVAANAASSGFLAAFDRPAVAPEDLNAVEVDLTRDGEELHRARAGDVMDDQWRALAWLISEVLARGHPLPPGHVLMTGSIGRMHPGLPGSYSAGFTDLGVLEFHVR